MSKRNISLICIMIFTIVLGVFLGFQKQGFYIDEYYTYTLADGEHLGISINDGQWNDTKPFFDELSISNTTRFSFARAAQNTADDVHPPLYYFCINFVCSLFPGIWSKWFAISFNILMAVLCELIMYIFAMKLTDENSVCSLTAVFAIAINPAFLSNMLYCRMYFMLAVVTLLYTYIHFLILSDDIINWRRLIIIYCLGVTGFLTHYYMLYVMFASAFFFCLYQFFYKKKYVKTIIYAITVFAVIITEYLLWSVFIFHMFMGYRGKEAIDGFLNFSGLIPRILAFSRIINEKMFGRFFIGVIVILVILLVTLLIKEKWQVKVHKEKGFITIFPILVTVFYFLPVAFSALSSNRFLFPMEPVLILYCVCGVFLLIEKITNRRFIALGICFSISIIILINAIRTDNIDYLYSERCTVEKYVKSNENRKALVFQDAFYDDNIDEFIQFDEVYFGGASIPYEKIEEDISNFVNSSDNIIVFIEKSRNIEEIKSFLINKFNHESLEYIGKSNEYYEVFVMP